MSTDPFSATYDALWSLVTESTAVKRLVAPKNRIALNANRDVIKDTLTAADLPELTLLPGSVNAPQIHRTSSSSSIVVGYEWAVATGDMRPSQLLTLEFALWCAMCGWKQIAATLKWKDKAFVQRTDVMSANKGVADGERNKGVQGWSSLWLVEVEMHFPTAYLIAENQ